MIAWDCMDWNALNTGQACEQAKSESVQPLGIMCLAAMHGSVLVCALHAALS